MQDSKTLAEALEWRYATKVFDPTKKIPAKTLDQILEAGRLAPSSFGLQPYHMVVVESPELRAQLKPVSFNQGAVTDASHLIVLRTKTVIDEKLIDQYFARVAATRGVPVESMAGYKQVILGFIKREPAVNQDWAKRQAYLAWGFMLLAAAELKVDTCPIEGLIPSAYDKLLKDDNYQTVAVMALGYRSPADQNAGLKKVRLSVNEFISRV